MKLASGHLLCVTRQSLGSTAVVAAVAVISVAAAAVVEVTVQ